MTDGKRRNGIIPTQTIHIVASVVYIGFALMCLLMLAAWVYLIGKVIGVWGGDAIDMSRTFTAFAMTVVIGCMALWAAGQVEIIEISPDVEKRIWNAVIAATISGLLSTLGINVTDAVKEGKAKQHASGSVKPSGRGGGGEAGQEDQAK